MEEAEVLLVFDLSCGFCII